MGDIIPLEVLEIQAECVAVGKRSMSVNSWATGLTITMLEVIHGQWLYMNVVVHDKVGRREAVQRKQDLQREIEIQIELGGEGLAEQDRHLLEVNLEYFKKPPGEDPYY